MIYSTNFISISIVRYQEAELATLRKNAFCLVPRTLHRLRPSFSLLRSYSLLYNTTLLKKQRTVTPMFCCICCLGNTTMIDCYCSVNCFAVVHTKGCLLDSLELLLRLFRALQTSRVLNISTYAR